MEFINKNKAVITRNNNMLSSDLKIKVTNRLNRLKEGIL